MNSDLPQAKETLSVNKITYICDFSRCRLNTRLHTLVSNPCSEATNIGYFIYWELSLAAYSNSEFILRKIWGRLQQVVIFWGIEILEDWHLSYHFKSFDIITIFGKFLGFSHSPYNFFAFFRACLKNAFCKMCVTICGRFRLNEGGVAGYANWMKAKYTANWGVQIVGMIFQTRSSIFTTNYFVFSKNKFINTL